jgi:hypothetical protein
MPALVCNLEKHHHSEATSSGQSQLTQSWSIDVFKLVIVNIALTGGLRAKKYLSCPWNPRTKQGL